MTSMYTNTKFNHRPLHNPFLFPYLSLKLHGGPSMASAEPNPHKVNDSALSSTTTQSERIHVTAQFALRVSAIAFVLVSISVMVTSQQSITLFGFDLTARYSYASSLKFLLVVEALVAASSLCSLVFVHLLSRSGSHLRNYFLLFLHDLVMVLLMMSGCAAATAVGYVGQYGQVKSGWMPICNRVPKFCNKMLVSSVFAYLAFFCYLSLTILSAYKLMSRTTTY